MTDKELEELEKDLFDKPKLSRKEKRAKKVQNKDWLDQVTMEDDWSMNPSYDVDTYKGVGKKLEDKPFDDTQLPAVMDESLPSEVPYDPEVTWSVTEESSPAELPDYEPNTKITGINLPSLPSDEYYKPSQVSVGSPLNAVDSINKERVSSIGSKLFNNIPVSSNIITTNIDNNNSGHIRDYDPKTVKAPVKLPANTSSNVKVDTPKTSSGAVFSNGSGPTVETNKHTAYKEIKSAAPVDEIRHTAVENPIVGLDSRNALIQELSKLNPEQLSKIGVTVKDGMFYYLGVSIDKINSKLLNRLLLSISYL